MRLGRPLPKSFFDRACADVARDLVGCVLVRQLPNGSRLAGRLVEVEAYLGDGSDPGSHCHVGLTPRNASMWGPPGRVYTYLSYGVHTCANLVCEPKGQGAGILLRAVEPLLGIDEMRRRRRLLGEPTDRRLAGGPGRLAQAFGLTLEHDGVSALRGEWTVRQREDPKPPDIRVSTRIGLSKGAELPLRFVLADSPWLSRRA